MGTDVQLVIVGTGYCPTIYDYERSNRYAADRPRFVIERDGTVSAHHIGSNVVALANVGPLVNENGIFYPATRRADGRYEALTHDYTVRVPYEFCTCRPYHGNTLYEFIPDRQLEMLAILLRQMLEERGLAFPYDNQLGVVCPRAVAGRSGIYFASSYTESRADIHPQKELLSLIKSLAK